MAKTTTGPIPKGRSFFRLSGRIAIAMVLLVSAAAFAAGSSAASFSFISSIGEMLGIQPTQTNGTRSEPIVETNNTSAAVFLTDGSRGYATNSEGTSYSEDGTFTTAAGVVQTASVTNSPQAYTGDPQFAAVSCSGGGVAFNILTGGVATQTDAHEDGYAVQADCPATPGYLAGTGLSAGTFFIEKINQTPISVTGPLSVTFGSPGTITIAGGSGTGALSYSAVGSTGCLVSSSSGEITVTDVTGTCTVTATRAADTNHHAAASSGFGVTLNKATSATIIDCSPGAFPYTGLPVEPCSATVTRVGDTNATATITYANNVAIGVNTATANAGYAGDNNHTGSTAPQVTFSIEVPSLTFDSAANLPAGTYQDITVQSGGVVTVTGNIVVAGCVTVEDGGTLLMGGFTFTGSGCFTVEAGGTLGIGSAAGISSDGSNGNVQVQGAISFGTGASYIYNGTGDQVVGSGLPSTVADLGINNSGTPGTVTGNSGQVVTVTLSITDGVYVSSSDYHNVVVEAAGTLTLAANITVSGNWTNNGGTLDHDNFGVIFDGSTGQTITGNTTFYDFEKSNGAGQTMFFTAGSTTTVENNLTLNGAAGSRLLLRSTLNGSEWNIVPNSISANHVDVQDSNNTGTSITVFNSINRGNNTGWTCRLVITPDAGQSKVFGTLDPTLTYTKDITDLNVSATGALSYSGGSNVGLHPITLGNLAAVGYTLILNAQNFGITQGVDTPSVSNSPQTYTGNAINIVVTCPSGGPATNVIPANQTNVGVYPVTASCPGNSNYSATTNVSAGNFEIIKPTDAPSVSNSPQTYTGNPIAIAVSCVSGGMATATSPVSQTNVGVYPVTASCPGNANYSATASVTAGSFEITQAATTTTITCPESAVYTGSAIMPCTYTVTGPGLLIGPLAVASGDYTNNLNVGVASASHNYAGGGNYAASSDLENFNITPAAPSCTVTGYNVPYDGNPHTTANGTCTGVLAENVPGTFSMSATTHSIPGTYNDPWTFTPDSANYSTLNSSVTNMISFCSVVSIQTGITSHGGGADLEIPINTTSVTDGNLAAAQFTFNYSPSVLDPTPANISVVAGNVLSPSSVIMVNANNPGSILVSISNTQDEVFAGTGSIVTISMKVLGGIGSTTALTLTDFKWFTAGPPIAEVFNCGPSLPGDLTVISGTINGTVRYTMDINYPVPGPHSTPTPAPTSVSKVVKDVAITATGPSPLPTPNQVITDSAGLYSMNGFGNGVYSIAPFKTPQTCGLNTNGINSIDPTLISRRVVNLITFSEEQEKAARVSGLGFVNALDATLVARFLVCIPNPGSRVGLWNFDPSGNSPVDNVNGGTYHFKALLMGDVSGDWTPVSPEVPGPSELHSPMTAARVSVPNVQAEPNSSVTVPLRLDNLYGASVDSYQFEIRYDPAVIQPSEIAAQLEGTASEGMNLVYNVPNPGSLLVVVYGVLPANGDGVYANLKFVTIGAIGSSSPLTINGFRFNDGKTEVVTSNGVLFVDVPSNPEINGRVLGPEGQAVRNAQVFLTATNGESVAVNSSSLGYFQFGGLTLGETYTISVRSRRYRFAPQTISITDSLAFVDMIGLE